MGMIAWLVPLLILPFIGGLPICRAFEAGLEAARDPANRATPESPWHFFGRAAWRRIRRWVVIWAIVVLVFFVFVGIVGGVRFGPMFAVASFMSFLAAALLFQGVFCWLLSPRVRSIGGLVAGGSFVSTTLSMVLWIALSFLPEPIGRWSVNRSFPGGGGSSYSYSLGVFWALLIALIVYTAVRSRAKRMGSAWFRFEE